MAINKAKKTELIKQYVQDLKNAKNVIVFQQSGITVTDATALRKAIRDNEGRTNVIRKRLFLRALKEAGYDEIAVEQLQGPAVVVYATGDEYAPLKSVNKQLKEYSKKPDSKKAIAFLGGWFDKKWSDAVYVTELANVPTREESLSKLVWMFKYPLQSMASVLDKIAKKKEAN